MQTRVIPQLLEDDVGAGALRLWVIVHRTSPKRSVPCRTIHRRYTGHMPGPDLIPGLRAAAKLNASLAARQRAAGDQVGSSVLDAERTLQMAYIRQLEAIPEPILDEATEPTEVVAICARCGGPAVCTLCGGPLR